MNDPVPDSQSPDQSGSAGDAPAGRQQNPYGSPADAPAPAPPPPRVLPWVLGCGVLGAALLGYFEFNGRIGRLSDVLPLGLGGAAVGFLCGGICGRVIGRLLIARHSFRSLHHRHAELRDELEERRKR